MSKIYIVQGCTGEYSDFQEWTVCAYTSEEAARDRVVELEHILLVNKAQLGCEYASRERAEIAMHNAPNGDPSCTIDYTGANYHYEECELIGD